MKKTILLNILCYSFTVLLLCCNNALVLGQGTAINTSGASPDNSAILDVSSNQKGMLIPRMTDQERNAITNPANGLTIFNTSTNCFNIYINGMWTQLCPNCIAPPTPVASSNSPLCSGDTLKLYASSVPGAISYSWTGPNGFTSTSQNPVIPMAGASQAGVYQVAAYNGACTGNAGSVTVTVNPVPSSSFTLNPSVPIINQACTFSPAVSGATYNWTFQNGNPATSNVQNPSVTWSTTGTYSVTLVVSQNGCQSGTTTSVVISNCYNHSLSQTFSYTGAMQTWTVPAGVCSVTIEVWGAEGGAGNGFGQYGGLGGYATGTLNVSAGQVLNIFVGGKGIDNTNGAAGGWNGGGVSAQGYTGCGAAGSLGGSGGGGSDVRVGGTTLNDRIIVAGGGGGGGNNTSTRAGAGGGLTGGNGAGSYMGYGGTQTAGGAQGSYCYCTCASDGSFGQGGYGNANDGGGGGGGWYGGGGGGNNDGGGGGSGYIGGVQTGSMQSGIQSGNGQVKISY